MEKVTTADLVAEAVEPNLDTGRLEPPTAVAEEAAATAEEALAVVDETKGNDRLAQVIEIAAKQFSGG